MRAFESKGKKVYPPSVSGWSAGLWVMNATVSKNMGVAERAHPPETIGVTAAMVELDGKDHLSLTTSLPDSASIHGRQVGALHAVERVRRVHVLAFLGRVPAPRGSACQAAGICYRGEPRGPPLQYKAE